MQPGFLQSGGFITFNKQRRKILLNPLLNPKDPENVIISEKLFTSSDFNGFICKDCGLVLFDYKHVMTRWF